MTIQDGPPPGIDPNKPSIARVYDYMLGGKDNFAIDRQTGDLALQITPDGFLDVDQPVGLLLFAILHHLNDSEDLQPDIGHRTLAYPRRDTRLLR